MLCLCLAVVTASAKKDDHPRYDIMSAGSGAQGTYLVKVYVYGKKPSDDELKYAAIHGVLFRGVTGTGRQPTQRPMISNVAVEQEKADFFLSFFGNEGHYRDFATVVPGTYERTKVPEGYKVGAVVQVMKDQLRKNLEQFGVIRSLGGW